jgi:hypothetical protein
MPQELQIDGTGRNHSLGALWQKTPAERGTASFRDKAWALHFAGAATHRRPDSAATLTISGGFDCIPARDRGKQCLRRHGDNDRQIDVFFAARAH